MKRISLKVFKEDFLFSNRVKLNKTFLVAGASLVIMSLVLVNSLRDFSNLSAGGETCFTRVRQTLTALARQSYFSTFVSSDFYNNTNRCFDELKSLSAKSITSSLLGTKIKRLIDGLASDVFEFTQTTAKVNKAERKKTTKSAAAKNFSQNSEPSIEKKPDVFISQSRQFENLEESYLILMEELSAVRANYELVFLFLLIFTLVLFSFLLYTSFKFEGEDRLIKEGHNNFIESIAADFLSLNKYKVDELEKIISILKKRFKLLNTSEYLKAYAHAQASDDEKFDQIPSIDSVPIKREVSSEQPPSTKDITSILNVNSDSPKVDEFNVAEKGLKEIIPVSNEISSFDESFQTSIELVRDQAFKHGIVFNLDIEDEVYVQVPREDLSQVIYTLVNVCIRYSVLHNKGRKISLRLKGIGGQCIFSIIIENFCFGTKELEFFNDQELTHYQNEPSIENLGTDIIILKESLSSLGVNYSMRNIFENNNYRGNIQLFFKQVKRPENFREESSKTSVVVGDDVSGSKNADKELKNLFKGSKKDFLQKIGRKKKKKHKRHLRKEVQ